MTSARLVPGGTLKAAYDRILDQYRDLTLAAFGALSSGFLFPALLKRGLNVNRARKSSMLFYAVLIVPMPLALVAPGPIVAALIIGLALFAHQGFSTNIFGLAADTVPTTRVAGVMALGGVAGQVRHQGVVARYAAPKLWDENELKGLIEAAEGKALVLVPAKTTGLPNTCCQLKVRLALPPALLVDKAASSTNGPLLATTADCCTLATGNALLDSRVACKAPTTFNKPAPQAVLVQLRRAKPNRPCVKSALAG
mgnify:CR=1 FL=1